jgi:GTP pyrophosphokinase
MELTAGDWGDRYRAQRPLYERFTDELATLLDKLLRASGIDAVQIEYRTKEVDSFIEKIRRKGEKYDDPLREISDLSGLRIIVYYLEDVERVGALLHEEFALDGEHFNDARPTAPDQFGYASVHYVLRLSDTRTRNAEWRMFTNMAAEVQIRTALQHAWAAIDHKLQYKRPQSKGLPSVLQRDLFRLSALLELADKEFSALRRATAATQEQYSDRLEEGELSIPLDSLSIEVYLDSAGVEERWYERAIEKGYLEPIWDAFGSRSETAQLDRTYLLQVTQHAGLKTVAALDDVMSSAEEWGESALDLYAQVCIEKTGEMPYAWPSDLITILVMMRFGIPPDVVPDPEYAEESDPWHWGGPTFDALFEAVDRFEGQST